MATEKNDAHVLGVPPSGPVDTWGPGTSRNPTPRYGRLALLDRVRLRAEPRRIRSCVPHEEAAELIAIEDRSASACWLAM